MRSVMFRGPGFRGLGKATERRLSSLHRSRASLLEPGNVIIQRVESDGAKRVAADNTPGVGPLLDLGMAVGESETAGAVVIAGRGVEEGAGHHRDSKRGVVDAGIILIDEHPEPRRRGPEDVAHFAINRELLVSQVVVGTIEPWTMYRLEPAHQRPDGLSHREAAYPLYFDTNQG